MLPDALSRCLWPSQQVQRTSIDNLLRLCNSCPGNAYTVHILLPSGIPLRTPFSFPKAFDDETAILVVLVDISQLLLIVCRVCGLSCLRSGIILMR